MASSDGRIETNTLNILLWLGSLGFVGTGIFFWIKKPQKASFIKNLILAAAAFLLTFYASIGCDRIYGLNNPQSSYNLLYPANSSALHETKEFGIEVNINSIGIRDKEYAIDKKDKYRILVIGDSFTFGWGVDLDDCWAKQLERKLQEDNPNIEVLNIGQGGASPIDYVKNAKKAIPLLKPDLVLVGLLSGNDIAQLSHVGMDSIYPNAPQPTGENFKEFILRIGKNLYPNLLRDISFRQVNIKEGWKQEAHFLMNLMTEEQKERFSKIDKEAKELFLSGNLNPALIQDAVLFPDYYTFMLDSSNAGGKLAKERLTEQLAEFKSFCQENSCDLKLLCIPNKPYVCPNNKAHLEQLGFEIPDTLLHTYAMDSAIEYSADSLKIELFTFTDEFRLTCEKQSLYYQWDGHFNVAGNTLMADLVFNKVFSTN